MAKIKQPAQVYQLKIALKNINPPIWRQVQVTDCTLGKLHGVIQICMGWKHYHLHEFTIDGARYGNPSQWQDDFGDEPEIGNERKVKLSQLAGKEVKTFTYVYDIGDNWEHIIEVEKVLVPETGVRYPRCIAGERACPPEDCGGKWGYGNFLDAIKNPEHEEHKELMEWIGGKFDPEAFDIEAVNKKLR
jgi:Plasmid pRiA4b ORF-3-like protein